MFSTIRKPPPPCLCHHSGRGETELPPHGKGFPRFYVTPDSCTKQSDTSGEATSEAGLWPTSSTSLPVMPLEPRPEIPRTIQGLLLCDRV